MVLEPLGLECGHASPTASDANRIRVGNHILSACSGASAREPREERYAHVVAIEIPCCEAVVELEGVNEVDSACCAVVGTARSIDIGGEEQLGGFDGFEVDVVNIKDPVECYTGLVDRCQGPVPDLCQEGNSFDACVSIGQGDAGQGAEIEVLEGDGRIACAVRWLSRTFLDGILHFVFFLKSMSDWRVSASGLFS